MRRYNEAVQFHRRHRHLSAWFALLALWLAVATPMVSHALSAAGASVWVEVCTAQGMRLVPVAADHDAGSTPASLLGVLDHCPYCSLGAHGAALPVADVTLWTAPTPQALLPRRFLSAPHTAPTWRSAQPQAPPARA